LPTLLEVFLEKRAILSSGVALSFAGATSAKEQRWQQEESNPGQTF
jgi:hypothetical protein